ncbi:hypothetical protein ANO11243_016240 [Dothideomycetidae sp. 11243]|nr:hypothetical protein ANO11243_016240 [fungal sp. No.11243]
MSTSLVTYNILSRYPTATLNASLISADATATALFFPCFFSSGEAGCESENVTVTVGPWAQVPPLSATRTGVVDMLQVNTYSIADFLHTITTTDSLGETITTGPMVTQTSTYSIHCAVTLTAPSTASVVASHCVTSWATRADSPFPFVPQPTQTTGFFVVPQPILITAGLEKFEESDASKGTSSRKTSSSRHTSRSTSTNATETATGTTSSATATGTHSGAASAARSAGLGTLGLAALIVGFLLR